MGKGLMFPCLLCVHMRCIWAHVYRGVWAHRYRCTWAHMCRCGHTCTDAHGHTHVCVVHVRRCVWTHMHRHVNACRQIGLAIDASSHFKPALAIPAPLDKSLPPQGPLVPSEPTKPRWCFTSPSPVPPPSAELPREAGAGSQRPSDLWGSGSAWRPPGD